MTVRRPTDSPPPSPVAPPGGVRADGRTGTAGTAAPADARPAPGSAPDRLELSGAAHAPTARRAASDDPEAAAELERARVALRAGAEMSPQRLHDLRERVRTGHYDQPDAIARMADAAARDLAGGGPASA